MLLNALRKLAKSYYRYRISRLAILEGSCVLSKYSRVILSEGSVKDDVHIATNTMMHGKIYSESRGKVRIGRHSSVRRESMFWCVESIDIGENVIISDHVLIMDNNNHPVDPGERLDMIRSGWSTPSWKWRNSKSAPVVIEDNVWIGKDSKVLKGVTVGENSIIAIGSVVTKDVPRNSVVAGNPAKIVRTLE